MSDTTFHNSKYVENSDLSPITMNNPVQVSLHSQAMPNYVQNDINYVSRKKARQWTPEEDSILSSLVIQVGAKEWAVIARFLPSRTNKQCRERWFYHLNPDIKKGEWTQDEDKIILDMQQAIGNKWTKIRKMLPGRSDNDIKNRFHALERQGTRHVLSVNSAESKEEMVEALPMYYMKKRKFLHDPVYHLEGSNSHDDAEKI